MTEKNESNLVETHFLEPKSIALTANEKNDNIGERNHKDSLRLYFAAFTATLILFGSGTAIVWTSPVIGRLKSNDTNVNPLGAPVTTLQISQIAGILLFGAMLGPLILSKLCDILGRRKTIMTLSLAMLISDVVLALAKDLYLYYLCRFILGLATGVALSTLSIFLGEISEDHNRGKIGCFIGLLFPMGNLYVYIIGPFLSIKVFTLFCAVPYIVNLLSFIFYIPESPVWLASKGRREEAINALEKLRDKKPSDIEKEYEKIINTLNETSKSEKGSLKILFSKRSYRKGLVIASGCYIIQQLSGVSAILAFAAPLFDEAQCGISGHMTGILIGSIKSLALFVTTNIIEKAGRRPLLLISSSGVALSLFLLGLYFYLQSINSVWIGSILWMPVSTVLAFFVLYSTGIGCIPMVMVGELFPNNIKATAASLVTFIAMATAFIVTTSFPLVKDILGPTWCIWGFSIASLMGFIFVYVLVPEMKGRSFMEVQEILNR